uniref:Uncharacterized protein n=1 Tax=Chenopodium quinoa TaxID=63459 RepID=A0A803MLX5_CHEQI
MVDWWLRSCGEGEDEVGYGGLVVAGLRRRMENLMVVRRTRLAMVDRNLVGYGSLVAAGLRRREYCLLQHHLLPSLLIVTKIEQVVLLLEAYEVTWIKALLKDLTLSHLDPAVLKCDNKAALAITANLMMHERTKHVEIDCHYVRDMVKAGTIETKRVSSSNQVAEIFTKVLSVKQHNDLLLKLGVTSPPASRLKGDNEVTI